MFLINTIFRNGFQSVGIIFSFFLLITLGPQSSFAENNVTFEVIEPLTLESRGKPYKFNFNLSAGELSENSFVQIKNGDGRDLKLSSCTNRWFFKRIFCKISQKIKKFLYYRNHVLAVKVKVNGKNLVKTKDLWGKGEIEVPLTLKTKNKVKIKIIGKRNTSITFRIFKKISDEPPKAQFQINKLSNNSFEFDGSTSSDNGVITSYHWDFGDGSSSTGEKVSYQYAAAGIYPVTLSVEDNLGLTNSVTKNVEVIQNNSPVANFGLTPSSGEAPLMVAFDASGSSDPDGDQLTYKWDFGDGNSSTGITASHIFQEPGQYSVTLSVEDPYGATDDTSKQVESLEIVLPPNPTDIAPPNLTADNSGLYNSLSFLFLNDPPVQREVNPLTIGKDQVAWIRGKVKSRDGLPLSGIKVSILNHPEFGFTYTRTDGHYDLLLNGGLTYTVKFSNSAYLPVQRRIDIERQSSEVLEDVYLSELDSKTLPLINNSPTPQILTGSESSDSDGTRQGTIFIPPNTNAEIVLPDGSRQTLNNLNVRITEYTVGENGPNAMPGTLPPTTAYTYAMELSVDEAIAQDSDKIEFSQPLAYYVDNFLNIPVGSIVPLGYYNTDEGTWEARPNGIVIQVTGIENGQALLSFTSDGAQDAEAENAFNITTEEKQIIASRFAVGESFWRVQIDHFSAYDLNYFNYLSGNGGGGFFGDQFGNNGNNQDNRRCSAGGSFFEYETRAFGERMPVYGTPFTLTYKSNRVPGYKRNSQVHVNYSGRLTYPSPFGQASAAVGRLNVAGRSIDKLVTAFSSESSKLYWDGKDAFGRSINGLQKVEVETSTIFSNNNYSLMGCGDGPGGIFRFDYFACARAQLFDTFQNGELFSGRNAQTENQIRKRTMYLGVLDWRDQGFGGWSLDIHHSFNPIANRLYRGDGSIRIEEKEHIDPIVKNCYQTTTGCPNDLGNSGPAIDAEIGEIVGMGYLSDGSLVIADRLTPTHSIRKISQSGIITNLAGGGANSISDLTTLAVLPNGEVIYSDNNRVKKLNPISGQIVTMFNQNGATGYNGDGGAAVDASSDRITDLAVGVDGSIFIGTKASVRKITSTGIVQPFAGRSNNQGVEPVDGLFSRNVDFSGIDAIAIDNDGSLLIGDNGFHRVYRIKNDGTIEVVVGVQNLAQNSGDRGLARDAQVTGVSDLTVDSDGNIFIALRRPNLESGTIRKIDSSGYINSIFGIKTDSFNIGVQNSAGSYVKDYFSMGALSLAFDSNQRLVVGERFKISKVDNLFRISQVDGGYRIPSNDGEEIYYFDESGKHLETKHTLTRATKYKFSYENNRLKSIIDGDDKVTEIFRDADGNIEKIVSHYGVETIFSTDSNGYLDQVLTPENENYEFSYTEEGLMTRMDKPEGAFTEVTYNPDGEMVTDSDALGSTFRFFFNSDEGIIFLHNPLNGNKYVQNSYFSENAFASNFYQEDRALVQNIYEGNSSAIRKEDISLYNERRTQDPFEPTRWMIQDIVYQGAGNYDMLRTRTVQYDDPSNKAFSEYLLTDEYLEVDQYVTRKVFSSRNNETVVTSPEGRITRSRTDDQGRIIYSEIDGILPVNYNYRTDGKLQSITQGDRELLFSYDSNGYVSEVRNPLGEKVIFQNDSNGRVTRQMLDDGREIEFSYDQRGNLSGVRPAGRPWHQMSYNKQDLIEAYVPPAISGRETPTRYVYNPDKDLTRIIRGDGKEITYSINDKRQITSVDTSEGTSTYQYNPYTKQLSQLTSEDGVVLDLGYRGEEIGDQNWSDIGPISLYFDNRLNQAGNSFEGGAVLTGDKLFTGGGFSNFTITYKNQNRLIDSVAFGNGYPADSYGYNLYGELTSFNYNLRWTDYFMNYERDKLGRITRIDEKTYSGEETKIYTYDRTGRLETVQDSRGLTTYSYDSNNNIIQVSGPETTVQGTYDAQDRLLTLGGHTFTYNDHGELKSKTNTTNSETTTYSYDSFGNLKEVSLPSGETVTYKVDGMNRRVMRSTDGGNTFEKYIYKDQLNIVGMIKPNGDRYKFYYGSKSHVPESMNINGTDYRFVTDHLGSVREVWDNRGNIVQELKYDAYGKVLIDSNPGFQPFGFAGGLYDNNTGLIRFGARDYDGSLYRWLSKDPILFDGKDSNLYGYVHMDPISFKDLDGYFSTGTLIGGAILIGGGLALWWWHEIGRDEVKKQFEEFDRSPQSLPPEIPQPKPNGGNQCLP